jgi:hypothetical protein
MDGVFLPRFISTGPSLFKATQGNTVFVQIVVGETPFWELNGFKMDVPQNLSTNV